MHSFFETTVHTSITTTTTTTTTATHACIDSSSYTSRSPIQFYNMLAGLSLLGSEREEDDYHFFRNLHLLAAQQKTNGDTGTAVVDHGKLLENLVNEMSFWNAVSDTTTTTTIANNNNDTDTDPAGGPSQKRRRSRTTRSAWNASAGSLSFATRFSSKPKKENCQTTSHSKEEGRREPVWKSAVDPATGQTYYYDSVTRHTQWHKPPEVRELEKKRKAERRQRDLVFFKEMEGNISKSLKRGYLIPGVPQSKSSIVTAHHKRQTSVVDVGPPREPRSPPKQQVQLVTGTLMKSSDTTAPTRIRTISSMDQVLLAELRDDKSTTPWVNVRPTQDHRRHPHETQTFGIPSSEQRGRPPLPVPAGPSSSSSSSNKQAIDDEGFDSDDLMELSPDPAHTTAKDNMHPLHRNISSSGLDSDLLAGESLLDEPIQTDADRIIANELTTNRDAVVAPPPGQHFRRNTGGTIHLQNTIYNPDIKATIKCVCGVYRAHIVQAVEQEANRSPVSVIKQGTSSEDTLDEKVFNDKFGNKTSTTRSSRQHSNSLPSLTDVLAFYEEFYGRSQMEHDTILMSLIYVERLIKTTNGVLAPNPANWRSVLFACMVLASKVWDDLSMWNIDFSNVSAASTAGLSSFTLPRINQLELAVLKALNFDVRVPASEYAKYYFLIRTMLLRSGLVQEGSKQPLLQRRRNDDDASFSKLESLTTHYQDETLAMPKTNTKGNSTNKNGETIPRPEAARFRAQSLDGVLSFLPCLG